MESINIKLFEEFKADLNQDKYFAAERINQAVALILSNLPNKLNWNSAASFSFDTKQGKMFVIYNDKYDEVDEDAKYYESRFEIDFHTDEFQEHIECTIDNAIPTASGKFESVESVEYSIVYDDNDQHEDIIDIIPLDTCNDNIMKMSKAFFDIR